jgi:hypothetical protein
MNFWLVSTVVGSRREIHEMDVPGRELYIETRARKYLFAGRLPSTRRFARTRTGWESLGTRCSIPRSVELGEKEELKEAIGPIF